MKVKKNTPDVNEENTPQDAVSPQLNMVDIMLLKQVVEVASSRGAFRANELTQIGGAYDRVSAWLDVNAPPELTGNTEESAEEEGETDA